MEKTRPRPGPRARVILPAVPDLLASLAASAAARLMARTVRERLGTTWALAETGAAGPTGNRYGDAAGHSCFAVAGAVETARTLETGRSDREANMWAFTRAALELLDA